MKKKVTFSLPVELQEQLYRVVGKRGLSTFVAHALRKAIDEKEDDLKAAYRASEHDPDRRAVIQDWQAIDCERWDE